MVEIAAHPRVIRAQYEELPEGPPYFELIDGELVEMTRATEDHNELSITLIELWRAHLRTGPGGSVSWEPNLYLPGIEDVYHPNLVYVSRENRSIRRRKGIYGTPEVICEVLSPTSVRTDRGKKLEDYRRCGVRHVWLFDPDPPVMVEEFVLGDDGRYRPHATATAPAVWEPAAFPGWRVPLAELDEAVVSIEADDGEPGP